MSKKEKENEESDEEESEEEDSVEEADKNKNEQKAEDQPSNDQNKTEDKSLNLAKILFDEDKVTQYWKNQQPHKKGIFIDQIFPPIAESFYDKKMKNEGVEKMNIHKLDWKKSTDLIKKKDLILFPNKKINSTEIDFQINMMYN